MMDTKRSFSEPLLRVILVVGVVLVLANLAVAGVNLVKTKPTAGPAARPSGVIRVAEAKAAEGAASPAAQGAPIDAPAQGAPIDAPAQGAPIDAAPSERATPEAPAPEGADPTLGPPSRVIPKASVDMVEQYEKALGGQEGAANLWDFQSTKDGKWLKLTFTALGGFAYETPDPDALAAKADPYEGLKDQVPDPLKKLNGKPIVLVGFMVPVDIDRKGQVKSFALTQDQMFCCYGVAPDMNQWVMVTMDAEQTAKYANDQPIAAFGTLEIGEEIEEGYVLSLYRMKASEVITVRELLERTQEDS